MTWTQYEVWAEVDGHQELIETTHSKKEALALATKTFHAGAELVQVFEETSDGDYAEIETLSK
jgi:hypothetical protein